MKYEKLSARLSSLVSELSSQSPNLDSMKSLSVPLSDLHVNGTPHATIFIRCDKEATFEGLPGVHVQSKYGEIRTARVALTSLEALSQQDSVHKLSLSAQFQPLCDLGTGKLALPAFRTAHSGTTLKGKGVIVGVVDTGIDALHPSFNGRIVSMWDQTIAGVGWGAKNYGTILSGPTLAVSSDTHGHGTHVAGIAAGHHTQYCGIAPEADIIVVKTNFQNTSIADGVEYIFAEAARLGRPAVVNLSLGGHLNAHDGSDNLSEFIDALTGPGKIVVAAAGNEALDDFHASADIQPAQDVQMKFKVVPNSQPGSPAWVLLQGWYAPHSKCEIRVKSSTGGMTPFQPVIAGGPTTRTYTINGMRVRLTTPPASASVNGHHEFLVEIQSVMNGGLVQGGVWELEVRNVGTDNTRLDVWSHVPNGAHVAAFMAPFNDPDMKIGSPGCASEVITVASYTTRNDWIDSTGIARAVGLVADEMSNFSSPGPLRGGGRKPDVAAPGAMIASAMSHMSSPHPFDVLDADFVVNAGTSMACPFIAGVCALLLQIDPNMTPADIKLSLKNNSLIPGVPAGTHDVKWGYGLLDMSNL